MNNILLTGANGFVGSYFKNIYDDKFNIQTFSFVKDDPESLCLNDIDVVVHLSALVHQMGGAAKEEYERVNLVQTLELAQKAKESGVEHFIFMSSVKVYGEETDKPYSETSICKPEDEYGKSKLKAENELNKLEDEKFKVSIIRTPVIYGHGVKANIKNLVRLVQKIPILPFGKIDNRRSIIYVGNLCFFIDVIIEQQKRGIFLVADEKSVSTTELIDLIAMTLNKKVYLMRVPFFGKFLKMVKPSFYKRLFESLEVDNRDTLINLFGNEKVSLPYSIEDGIKFMIYGEAK